jgi:hypothetical protein
MRNRATWRAARRTHFAVKYHIDQRVHVDRKARFFSSLLVLKYRLEAPKDPRSQLVAVGQRIR